MFRLGSWRIRERYQRSRRFFQSRWSWIRTLYKPDYKINGRINRFHNHWHRYWYHQRKHELDGSYTGRRFSPQGLSFRIYSMHSSKDSNRSGWFFWKHIGQIDTHGWKNSWKSRKIEVKVPAPDNLVY